MTDTLDRLDKLMIGLREREVNTIEAYRELVKLFPAIKEAVTLQEEISNPPKTNQATMEQIRAIEPTEIDKLRAALVYTAYALHSKPQYMLAEGISLIDGDTVQVSLDGWKVQASVNPLRQAVHPKQPPAPLLHIPV